MTVTVTLMTAPDRETAERLASALVERRLAACVNIVEGITSVYRWEGVVQKDTESLLIVKSVAERYEELEAAVNELHPYDVPEIISVDVVKGASAYLDWVIESVGG